MRLPRIGWRTIAVGWWVGIGQGGDGGRRVCGTSGIRGAFVFVPGAVPAGDGGLCRREEQ